MRIAVIGDLQYAPGEEGAIARSLAQLRAAAPDRAVAMGDYCVQGRASRGQMWRDCADLLDASGMAYVPLLGNHDTEFAQGCRDEISVDTWYRAAFGRDRRDEAWVCDGVRFLCLSLAVQPEPGYVTLNVCMMERAQYEWAENALNGAVGAAGMPTVLFVHAPLAGNGLRQTPMIHSAATDAYVEQNHHPEWPRALLARHPEIVASVSAHFHMGQGYDSAISFARGLCDISCGVMTSQTRDGAHHSRLLDVSAGHLDVYTVDHDRDGALTLDLRYRGDLADLARCPERSQGRYTVHPHNCCLIGEDVPTACFAGKGRVFIATQKGFVWEFDLEDQSLRGAVARIGGAEALYGTQERLYCLPREGAPYSVGWADPRRFARKGKGLPRIDRQEAPEGRALPSIPYEHWADAAGTWVRW